MSSKKYLTTSAKKNGTTLNKNPNPNPNRKLIIAIIVLLVVATCVGMYFVIKSAIKKKLEDVVLDAGNIVIDVVNDLTKPIDNPLKKLDLTIRGVKGDELFSVFALDATGNNKTILLENTVANIPISLYSIPTVPFDTKTILFSYLNDQTGRDLVLEEFKLNGIDIRPLLIERPDNLVSVMNGRFLWGGDYKFDVSNII